MITKVVVILVASFLALAVAAQATEICVKENEKYKKPTSRGMAYFLCVVFVCACSVLWGLMVAAPAEPGDEIGANATSDETPSLSMPPLSNSNATAAWEDEGGRYSKCA